MSRITHLKPAVANCTRKDRAERIAELEHRILCEESESVITQMRSLTNLMSYTADSPDLNPDELANVAQVMNGLIDRLELALARESKAAQQTRSS